MTSNKVKRRTQAFKESLYNRSETILNIVYHLGNGIMLKEQLIALAELLDVNKIGNVPKRIEELLEEGFLKEKQVVNSNKYAVYLTRYPIGRIEKKPSNKVNGVKPTKEKILNSLFATEYIIETIIPAITKRPLTVELIERLLNHNSNTVLINKNNAEKVYRNILSSNKLAKMNFSKAFSLDKQLAEYEKEARLKKENTVISEELIKVKETYEKDKKEDIKNKTIKKEEEKYFNITNMLNRSFGIKAFRFDEVSGEFDIYFHYFDINNPDAYKLYSNIGYIYKMIEKYFDGLTAKQGASCDIFINVNVEIYVSNIKRKNELIEDANKRVLEFSTGGYKKHRNGANALINAKVPEMFLDKIKVQYKLFDFDGKYNIKIK